MIGRIAGKPRLAFFSDVLDGTQGGRPGEGGDLNDVLYTVKALGMVVSTDVEFRSGPAVVNGFSVAGFVMTHGYSLGSLASTPAIVSVIGMRLTFPLFVCQKVM